MHKQKPEEVNMRAKVEEHVQKNGGKNKKNAMHTET